jgi:hypothetical protein
MPVLYLYGCLVDTAQRRRHTAAVSLQRTYHTLRPVLAYRLIIGPCEGTVLPRLNIHAANALLY